MRGLGRDPNSDWHDDPACADFDEYRWGGYGDDLGAPLPPGSLPVLPLLIGLSLIVIFGALVLGFAS